MGKRILGVIFLLCIPKFALCWQEPMFRWSLGLTPGYSIPIGSWGGDLRKNHEYAETVLDKSFISGTADLTRSPISFGIETQMEFLLGSGLSGTRYLGLAVGYLALPTDTSKYKTMNSFNGTWIKSQAIADGRVIPVSLYYKSFMETFQVYFGGGIDFIKSNLDYDLTFWTGDFVRGEMSSSGRGYHIMERGCMLGRLTTRWTRICACLSMI